MKTCPIHDDFEYPDTLPECPACTRDRRLAKQDRTPEAPARASPLLEPTAGSSTVAGAPKRAQGATVSSNAQPRTGTEHQAGDSGTEHQEVDFATVPAEALFTITEVEVPVAPEDLPGKPTRRAVCARCGEKVMDGREVVREGTALCRPCAQGGSYYRPLPVPVGSR